MHLQNLIVFGAFVGSSVAELGHPGQVPSWTRSGRSKLRAAVLLSGSSSTAAAMPASSSAVASSAMMSAMPSEVARIAYSPEEAVVMLPSAIPSSSAMVSASAMPSSSAMASARASSSAMATSSAVPSAHIGMATATPSSSAAHAMASHGSNMPSPNFKTDDATDQEVEDDSTESPLAMGSVPKIGTTTGGLTEKVPGSKKGCNAACESIAWDCMQILPQHTSYCWDQFLTCRDLCLQELRP